jgi:hypothetical protein
MPRRASAPRLWFRPARHDAAGRLSRAGAYVILDRGKQITVGSADQGEAEQALAKYLSAKHTTRISRGKRDTDRIPVADVINIYARDVAVRHARPWETAARILRLLDFFGDKTLADIDGAACRAYAKQASSDAVARRDLEDLRSAINHHRKEGLHDRIVSVVLPPPRTPRERWLSRDEAAALVLRCWRRGQSKHVARFALVALYTGRRAAVVCGASFKRETRAGLGLTRGKASYGHPGGPG